jgi:hypothetical protein
VPPQNKVNVVRPDGSVLSVTPEQASKLKLLGYRDESNDEANERALEQGRENYYSTGTQKLKTAGEGVGRGLSLGATDYLFGDDDTRARAQYNPGVAIGTEILGALAPLVLSGGATAPEQAASFGVRAAARLAPTAALSRGGAAVGEAVGVGGRFGKAAVAGVVEGGVYGGAQAANHAYLTNDPITAETILHGAGWGMLFGGGAAVAGEALIAGGQKIGRQLAEKEAKAAAAASTKTPDPVDVMAVGKDSYGRLHGEVATLNTKLTEMTKAADAVITSTNRKLANLGASETAGVNHTTLALIKTRVDRAYKAVNKAVTKGDAALKKQALADYKETIHKATEQLGVTAKLGNPAKALDELAQIASFNKELTSFPKSPEAFTKLSLNRAERLFATLEGAKKLSAYPELGKAVDAAAVSFGEAIGVKIAGVDGLRTAYSVMKEQVKSAGATKVVAAVEGAGKAPSGGGGYMPMFGVYSAGAAVGGPIGGIMAVGAARKFMSGERLAAMRNAAVARLQKAASTYMPKAGKAIRRIGPRIEPLAVKLDGTFDSSSKSREDMAAARVKEFWNAYPTVNDTLYKSVESLGITQPELGAAVHAAGVAAFKSMLESVPRDPGVVSGLKSIWKPSMLQAEVLSRRLQVFHDPVGQAEEMLSTGDFDPIKIKTLKAVAPAVYQELRMGVIDRIAEPGIMDKMSYNDQIGVGTMLDIPIHSSMRPEHIAASQMLFQVRKEPMPMPVKSSEGSSGGRPAGNNENATQSQRITDR